MCSSAPTVLASTSRPSIRTQRSGSSRSSTSNDIALSRKTFCGQLRRVWLLTQTQPSRYSNQAGFICTEPSARLVPMTARKGWASRVWAGGLNATPIVLLPTPPRGTDPDGLDLQRNPLLARLIALVLGISGIAQRETINVFGGPLVVASTSRPRTFNQRNMSLGSS